MKEIDSNSQTNRNKESFRSNKSYFNKLRLGSTPKKSNKGVVLYTEDSLLCLSFTRVHQK